MLVIVLSAVIVAIVRYCICAVIATIEYHWFCAVSSKCKG